MALHDDPARLDIGNYPLRYTSRVLFADMDGFRHINNVAIARFFEEGRAAGIIEAFGLDSLLNPPEGRTMLLASNAIDYIAQAYYPGDVEVGSSILRVGSSSFLLAQAAFQNDKCFALANGTMVKALHDKADPLTKEERTQLLRFAFKGGQ
jgi:acyl-CoA thioester hydrolase